MIYIVRREKLYYAGERMKQQFWADTKAEAKGLLFEDAKRVVERSEGVVPGAHEIERAVKVSFEADDASRTVFAFVEFESGAKAEVTVQKGPRGLVGAIKPAIGDWPEEHAQYVKLAANRAYDVWETIYGRR